MEPNVTEIRALKWCVGNPGASLFSELNYSVEIVDEGVGEYVTITGMSQDSDTEVTIAINPEDWPMLREAIDAAIGGCR